MANDDCGSRLRILELSREVAGRLRFHRIAISIDNLAAEWPSLEFG